MKIPFINRFTGALLCEIEIDDGVRAELRVKVALEKAVKSSASLRSANLDGANLHGANLHGANLRSADFHGASLHGADLHGANLHGADFHGASLHGANLDGANLPAFAHCPEEGAFIAWKKLANQCVAKLEIPAKARRTSSLVGRKMRAEYVKTLAIWNGNGKAIKSSVGTHDVKTLYRVGKITRPDRYDDDPRIECTHGIHFFITRKEAENY